MGGSSWSDDHYTARENLRASGATARFAHTTAINSGKIKAETHTNLNPAKLKAGIREARDSDTHPTTLPIYIGLDVTGSMRRVPELVQTKLKELMGLLIRKSYVEHPAICVSAIGDAEMSDRAPFQVGQFESGVEVDDDLEKLYLEGGGGANRIESYDLALYFLARCVKTDAWEKRNEKGYAFIICDEALPEVCRKATIKRIFDQDVQADIPIMELVDEVKEKWNLFVIVPNMTQHYRSKLQDSWVAAIDQNVIFLDDPASVTETIGATIGLTEGITDLDGVVTDLTDVGGNTNGVSTALAHLNNGGMVRTGGTGLSIL